MFLLHIPKQAGQKQGNLGNISSENQGGQPSAKEHDQRGLHHLIQRCTGQAAADVQKGGSGGRDIAHTQVDADDSGKVNGMDPNLCQQGEQQRIMRFLENMCLGSAAVGYRTESLHGAGSPQAQRIMIARQGNIQGKKELAKFIAGIGAAES